MTDRAEIERMLQMTGRTLEGLSKDIGYLCSAEYLYDLVDLLVGALRDALDERNYAVLRLCEQDGCEGCKHEECPHEDEPCVSCCRMWQYEEDDNWEFGILGKKVEAEW